MFILCQIYFIFFFQIPTSCQCVYSYYTILSNSSAEKFRTTSQRYKYLSKKSKANALKKHSSIIIMIIINFFSVKEYLHHPGNIDLQSGVVRFDTAVQHPTQEPLTFDFPGRCILYMFLHSIRINWWILG